MKSFVEVNRYIDDFTVLLDGGSSYSLDRVKTVLGQLGNPQEKFKTVHIAGTSGKTSTAYYTASMLAAAGYKTGLTVSPHIDEVNERLQINLAPLPEKEFSAAFNEFTQILNTLSIKLTYFELIISFAYWYFAKAKIEYAVVEVGLGGLLDATNVIGREDKVCIITDIGLDHTHILGSKPSEVATQKAGIIQPGNQVFVNRQDRSVLGVIKDTVKNKNASIRVIEPSKSERPDNLAGFQRRNWQLAKQACDYIFSRDRNTGLSDEQWQKTAETLIPGRIEVISRKDKTIVLDGAHNAQKMHSFIESFSSKFPKTHPPVLLAVADTKAAYLTAMTDEIKNLAALVIVTEFESGQDAPTKSIDPEVIASHFGTAPLIIEKDISQAVKTLIDQKEDVLLVTGSLYLVRAVRKILMEAA